MMQRTPKLLALALATSLAMACARTAPPVPTPNAVATLASASGDVAVARAGTDAWAPATAGMRLAAGDRVWTRAGEADIQYFDETQSLRGGTVIEIRAPLAADSRR